MIMESYIIKIQKWYRKLPGCRKCASKRLPLNALNALKPLKLCVYCYHDKYSEDCVACKQGLIHTY
jgi:hypothetical protein